MVHFLSHTTRNVIAFSLILNIYKYFSKYMRNMPILKNKVNSTDKCLFYKLKKNEFEGFKI
jgi:hypothetical protein